MIAPGEPLEPAELTHGAYTARVSELGAALLGLRHDGRELVYRVEAAVPTPPYAGIVLAPWPNRIAGGRYRFADAVHQVPVNEVELGNALHGLVLWDRWTTVARTAASVTFEHALYPRPGYPFRIALSATYALGDDGLTVTVIATNTGDTAAPIGLSVHPYLTVGGDSAIDDWTMTVPCTEVLTVDDRLRPDATVEAGAIGFDFTGPRRIGDARIDHAFTGVRFGADGRAVASLLGPDGAGASVSWGTDCRWLQVYTMHAPGTAMHRRAVAFEPMTCAPDAFNSGDGLVVLEPGAATTMACTVSGNG